MDTDEIEKVIEKFDEDLATLDGKIVSRDKIGRKKLAYDIKKFRDGFFVNQIIALAADKVVELKQQLKFNDNVLRIMLLEESKKAQKV